MPPDRPRPSRRRVLQGRRHGGPLPRRGGADGPGVLHRGRGGRHLEPGDGHARRSGRHLARVPPRELDTAAAIIGYDEVVSARLPGLGHAGHEANADPGSFAMAPLDEAVGRLVAVIRRERPQVMSPTPTSRPSTPTPTTSGSTRSPWPPLTPPGTPTATPRRGRPSAPQALLHGLAGGNGCGPSTRSSSSWAWSRRSTTNGSSGSSTTSRLPTLASTSTGFDVQARGPAGPRHPGRPHLARLVRAPPRGPGARIHPYDDYRLARPAGWRTPTSRRTTSSPGWARTWRSRSLAAERATPAGRRPQPPSRASSTERTEADQGDAGVLDRPSQVAAFADQARGRRPGPPSRRRGPQLGAVHGRVDVHLGHARAELPRAALDHGPVPTPGTKMMSSVKTTPASAPPHGRGTRGTARPATPRHAQRQPETRPPCPSRRRRTPAAVGGFPCGRRGGSRRSPTGSPARSGPDTLGAPRRGRRGPRRPRGCGGSRRRRLTGRGRG